MHNEPFISISDKDVLAWKLQFVISEVMLSLVVIFSGRRAGYDMVCPFSQLKLVFVALARLDRRVTLHSTHLWY